MTTNLIIQYTIVGVILLAILTWLIVKLTKLRKNENDGCCGCSLSEVCGKKNLKTTKKRDCYS